MSIPDLPAADIPAGIPADIASDLDRAGVLAGIPTVPARHRARALVAGIRRRTRRLPAAARSVVDAELGELSGRIAASGRSWRRRQRDRAGLALGTALSALLSVLLLDLLWARDLVLPDIPVVQTDPGPPERVAWYEHRVALDSTVTEPDEPVGHRAGRDGGAGPGGIGQGAGPSPLGTRAPAVRRSSAAHRPPSTPQAQAGAEQAPSPAAAPPRARATRTPLRQMVRAVIPDTQPEPAPPEPAEAPEPETRALPTARTGERVDAVDAGPPPLGVGQALRRAGRPLLQVGVDPRVLALREDAPISFVAVGPRSVPEADRSHRFGLQVARTEVTQRQWATVRHMDLSSISGHWDNPAEAMSWCDALRFANALSRREGLQPAYELAHDCETGGRVRWDTRASGFRLLTEGEWLALAENLPGTRPDTRAAEPERVNNRGVYKVDAGVNSPPLKVRGLADNAREWVWGVDRRPDGAADHGPGRFQVHSGRWPRSVIRGCDAVDPALDPTRARMEAHIDEAASLSCRSDPPPAAVPLGVGLRLARGRP